ncbi:Protein of unknown function [Gryllus bimaculatus]|nr:Protein of unknown function [Gryllus bimaculatus]
MAHGGRLERRHQRHQRRHQRGRRRRRRGAPLNAPADLASVRRHDTSPRAARTKVSATTLAIRCSAISRK